MTRTRRLLAVLGLAAALACEEDLGPAPLRVALLADRVTADVGQRITFNVMATGDRLLGVVVDYGDESSPDSIGALGARTLEARRNHTYAASGRYQVMATAEEVAGAATTAELFIDILSPPPLRRPP